MKKLKISEFTEKEFQDFLTKICNSEYATEKQQIKMVLLFEKVTEHPDGSDLIYYANSDEESTPEAIIKIVKCWRSANGMEGFKPE